MNLYSFIRPALFKLDPETAHDLSLKSLKLAHRSGLLDRLAPPLASDPASVMGLEFPNRLGLAAGLDKNGDCIDGLAALGFGFLEIGTVTPRPQPGNPKPRLFRLPAAEAIINRMGFNNRGIDYLIERVKEARYRGVLGINIGKNFDTTLESAVEDYLICLRKAYFYASYIAINISSPNTKNLRQLQEAGQIGSLMEALKEEQAKLQQAHGRYVPLVIKIAPDLDDDALHGIGRTLLDFRVDGVIATNTTVARDAVAGLPGADETGGLSGAPLLPQSTQVVKILAEVLRNEIPIIAAGGIMSGRDAVEKIVAGASLVQVYSGLIYRGPGLVGEIAAALRQYGSGAKS